jgi:hypothetical protein
MPAAAQRRNLTPPEIARRYGVANNKVLEWIHTGELAALNLARRGCDRPRYSITPESLAAFERARAVAPQADPTPKLRRRAAGGVKEFF